MTMTLLSSINVKVLTVAKTFFYFNALLKKRVVKYECHNEKISDFRGYLGGFMLICRDCFVKH